MWHQQRKYDPVLNEAAYHIQEVPMRTVPKSLYSQGSNKPPVSVLARDDYFFPQKQQRKFLSYRPMSDHRQRGTDIPLFSYRTQTVLLLPEYEYIPRYFHEAVFCWHSHSRKEYRRYLKVPWGIPLSAAIYPVQSLWSYSNPIHEGSWIPRLRTGTAPASAWNGW